MSNVGRQFSPQEFDLCAESRRLCLSNQHSAFCRPAFCPVHRRANGGIGFLFRAAQRFFPHFFLGWHWPASHHWRPLLAEALSRTRISVQRLCPCGHSSGIPSGKLQQQSAQTHPHSPRAARISQSCVSLFIASIVAPRLSSALAMNIPVISVLSVPNRRLQWERRTGAP